MKESYTMQNMPLEQIVKKSSSIIKSCGVTMLMIFSYKIIKQLFCNKKLLGEKIRLSEISDYCKKVFAIHEAGHTVMAYLRNAESYQVRLSPTPCVTVTFKFGTIEDVRSMILVKYAGAVAEELLLGQYHVGCFGNASSDFEAATELIKGYITMINPDVSKSLLEEELSEQIIENAKWYYHFATLILEKNIDMVAFLAEELLKKKKLSTKEVARLLKRFLDKKEM